MAAGPVTGRRRTDLAAALKLLRTAYPVLPADADSGPDTVPAPVEEQRRARAAASYRLERGDDGEWASRIASSLSDGYGCWIPGGSEQIEFLKELGTWLRWQGLRLDMWCGPEGGDGTWASLYGTLDEVGSGMLALKPGGRHRPVRIPRGWSRWSAHPAGTRTTSTGTRRCGNRTSPSPPATPPPPRQLSVTCACCTFPEGGRQLTHRCAVR
ncbi:hypothetical protein LKL35_36005 [Streptomyces sp. ET3-23]|uniref:hypothetical protein n=1 Tax=Streptomyces sp. ET3-23 TaxID=2885643 RepID=UPI001D0F886F|nr:hypothetical protein [Streptomyces sp. ET3-23]MCC2280742.1 hypothetical protein [Streptomyces sp. ET3-23]